MSSRRGRQSLFPTIRTEGAILPADLLERIAGGDRTLPGLTPADYHLDAGEKLNEAVSRSWNRLLGLWKAFRTEAAALPADDSGTTLTRERWLLPLFRELGYGRIPAARATEIDGKTYPISHRWNAVPIHLLGCRVDIDRRSAGIAGASRTSPHGLLQEFLNRSHTHLWAFLANGLRLRILRDSARLTRQAYVEFDLESMLDGEVFPDFTLLWLLCHQSRVEGEKPEECLLERWSKAAAEEGARALDALRTGVEHAIAALGRGFLAHPANAALRDDLRSGRLDTQDYFRQLLRLVYRLIFLSVAEDRDLLLAPGADPAARERYLRHYSTRRFRDLAGRTRGGRHADLYEGFKVVADRLAEKGCPELGLTPLGSFLLSHEAVSALQGSIANADFLDAIRALAWRETGGALRPVDYRNLRTQELGSVYESLLELRPEMHLEAATFTLATLPGHERKTSGSYYTHDSLVQCLLDSALEPVIQERLKNAASAADAERAILSLRVCDPAGGSGHFLVAAAHRIAKRLAAVRTGDEEPSPEAWRTALRDVIGHCLYGVDLNPMAVELCKVSLWMEAMEPGKPLSFLDHRILCGNSLLGATPALIAKGIPDEAFEPIEGDDRKIASALKKRNKQERAGQMNLFGTAERPTSYNALREEAARIDALDDTNLNAVRTKEAEYRKLIASSEYHRRLLEADAWCAAFVWKKTADAPGPLTQEVFRRLQDDPGKAPGDVVRETRRLATDYNFFHWHLAYPEVFRANVIDGREIDKITGWVGGFDVVLGNPPWGQIQFEPEEFFAVRAPSIAKATNMAARRRMIDLLQTENHPLFEAYIRENRQLQAFQLFVHSSGRFPTTSYGRLNTAPLFCETSREIACPSGRVGLIVPTGIATDSFNQFFFQDVVETKSLVSLYSFENEDLLFPDIHHATRFCLFTAGSGKQPITAAADFVFFARQVAHLRDKDRRFTLAAEDIARFNPNTHTCPIFRSGHDAELTKAIYHRVPVLVREAPHASHVEENPWGIGFQLMFMMNTDSHLFRVIGQLESGGWRLQDNIFRKDEAEYLPLYEAKMIHLFDHRWGTYEGQTEAQANQGKLPELDELMHSNPFVSSLPRYWVSKNDVQASMNRNWTRSWFIGFRDITGATVLRTVIAAAIPYGAVGNKVPLVFLSEEVISSAFCFLANLCAFALDFAARQKIGGTSLNFYLFKQLPILPPHIYIRPCAWSTAQHILRDWLLPRVLELTYTAWDLKPFAEDCGYSGPPYRWDDDRRFLLRCELDAAFFHIYLPVETNSDWRPAEGETAEDLTRLKASFPTPRDAVAYIMDTFPIVKRKDQAAHGEYRTKRVILEIYDAMAEAALTGIPYQTRLDPPPADPRCAHPNTPPAWLTTPPHTVASSSPRPTQESIPTPAPAPRATSPAPQELAAALLPQRSSAIEDHLPAALDFLRANSGPRSKSEILTALAIPDTAWPDLSRRLAAHSNVEKTGERRGTRYALKFNLSH